MNGEITMLYKFSILGDAVNQYLRQIKQKNLKSYSDECCRFG